MSDKESKVKAGDVSKRVYEIIATHNGGDPAKITDNSKFIEDLGLDSLDIVELVMAFEEEFEQEIPDEDAEKLQTVGDVIRYIEGKMAA